MRRLKMKINYKVSSHSCEKCEAAVNRFDNFCKTCGHDLKKETVYVETKDNPWVKRGEAWT